MTLTVIPITGLPAVRAGDDLAQLLVDALRAEQPPEEGDVLVVTHKVVSKAEGSTLWVGELDEAAKRRIVEEEAVSIVRRRGELIIAETRHGFVCANAGVDRSNAEPGTVVLLPRDPDHSAHTLRKRLERAFGVGLAVIISDTFGRPWRKGLTDVAIGVSGIRAVNDLRGQRDWTGRVLEVTETAVADELASAADLVMGKSSGTAAALIRGYEGPRGEGRGADLVRPPDEDLFR